MADAATALQQGIELHKQGRAQEAAAHYEQALAADPANGRAAHYLGVIELQAGRLDRAIELLERAVNASPDLLEARNNYGVALRQRGRLAEAIAAFEVVAARKPDLFDAQNNLASTLLASGEIGQSFATAETAHRLNPRHPEPLITAAIVLLMRRDAPGAIGWLQRLLALDPNHAQALALHRIAVSRIVQPWHFPMMADTPRNDAYEAAIRRAVTPGSLVLDIGTGAGLLSMMSARAGAGKVVTCEMTPPMAEKAKRIVAANGLADRITVHGKRSDELRVGVELPDKADVLVSEIFESDLLGEGVLPSLEDARARLVKPDAKIIPQAASIMVALAGGEALAKMISIDKAAGFDVSALNEFTPERQIFDGSRFTFDWLSEPLAALDFDFRETYYPAYERVLSAKVTRGGMCLGLAQWLHVQLDDETAFDNKPGRPPEIPSGWMHSLYTFAVPVKVEAGQTLRFLAGHNRHMPYFLFVDVS
jgi:type III protein arginine methyltransferase